MNLLSRFYADSVLSNAFFNLQEEIYPWLDLRSALRTTRMADFMTPFGIFHEAKAISILNVTEMDLILNGRPRKAIQIGTVATDVEYRNLGFSKQLINHVITEYEKTKDLVFLFGNDQVLGFYPKFGFQSFNESKFVMAICSDVTKLRALKLTVERDRDLFQSILDISTPISSRFNATDAVWLRKYYCENVFQNHLYFDETHRLILVVTSQEREVTVHDVLGAKLPLSYFEDFCWEGCETLKLNFTPDCLASDFQVQQNQCEDGQLMIYSKEKLQITAPFKVPTLIHT